MKPMTVIATLSLAVAGLTLLCPDALAGEKNPLLPLTAQGETLLAKYQGMLSSLSKEVVSSLPAIDEKKKAAFLEARAAVNAITPPTKGSTSADVIKHRESQALAEANLLNSTRALLADLDASLASDSLDGKLMTIAILAHGTPRRLAEFAQQGQAEAALLDTLFADETLMKQILAAGRANGGNYGKAMQIYAAIQDKSERAREVGSIFQRLALGTAIEMDSTNPVERYLHYEKAYLDGELDPAFKDMTAWECRFITSGERSLEDLAWMREMLRTYRPDHIRNQNQKWRYVGIVKSDFPYTNTRKDPEFGTTSQQALALGGSCGPRAWFGRLASRAFGIPARKHPQVAHGAMSHWTPTGWTVNLGAWWSHSPGGLDFYLDSRAREFPEAYMQVVRAEWIGDALGEDYVDRIYYGQRGGFWKSLAFFKKEVMVADAAIAKSEDEKALEAMTADEAKTILGETDEFDGEEEEEPSLTIQEEHRKIVFAEDGTITIPAVACTNPTGNTSRIAFMESWDGGWQVHYQRLGGLPEMLKYEFELPADGTYTLTARVARVSAEQKGICRINRRTLVDLSLPYTKGAWQGTEPVTVDLREGRNTLLFTCPTGNRGVSIKHFTLTPTAL